VRAEPWHRNAGSTRRPHRCTLLECRYLDSSPRPLSTRRVRGAIGFVRVILKLLALETSTEWCSAAVWRDGEVFAREELAGHRHSEMILPMIDAVLQQAEERLAGLDAVAFGAGPGSFTGLRIACGVAQGLAFASGRPIVGVGTLLAVAQASGGDRVVSCLDARMGELYCAAFERGGGQWRTVHAPHLCTALAAPEVEGDGWVGAGSGFGAHGSALAERYAGRLGAVQAFVHPDARHIAALAVDMVRAGLALPAEEAAPIYLRDRVALTVEQRRALKAQPSGHAPVGNP
jgi:tRNA threonylcarbamoyladenosine biosynthesis protein TsaB